MMRAMQDPPEKAPAESPPPGVPHDAPAHFGLFPADRPGIGIGEAQRELILLLASLLPPTPARVVVVAAEPGVAVAVLSELGYAVTATAPSPGFAAGDAGADQQPAGLEPGSFAAAVLLDPGAGGATLHRRLGRAWELLREGGTAVLAGEVAAGRGAGSEAFPPTADDLTVALAETGFRPAEQELISEWVAPTCTAMARLLAAAGDQAAAGGVRPDQQAWLDRHAAFASGRLGYELRAVRKDPYVIRSYRDGDEDEILRMFREVFGVERTLDHWRWKFRDCPYGGGFVTETTARDGELTAHFAGYPVPFYSSLGGSREFFAHQVGDTMTRPSVRQAGLGRHGILARISSYYFARFCRDIPFVYGFNTGHIRKLGERYLGYTYIEPVGYWVKDFKDEAPPAPSAPRRWLSGYSFGEVTTASAELDALFVRARDDYGLLVRRDAEYLGWRYLRCPDRVHRVFAIRKWGRLVGWCAFARRCAELVCGDALVERRHAGAVAGLLQFCLAGPFRGVERAWAWFSPHPAWWSRVLEECGFARSREPNDLTPCFVFFEGAATRQELAERWYYTYGDSDLF
jgi:hypothetical protein